MNWVLDASAARHSGALTHHLGILPALDSRLEADRVHLLASRELADALDGRLHDVEVEVLAAAEGAGRILALNSRIAARLRELRPDAVVYGQYAPLAPRLPYVLRMTDAHLVDHRERSRLLRFYSPLQRVAWKVKIAAFRRSARGAGAILCATHAVRGQLLAAHPELVPERILVAYYGPSPLVAADVRHPGPRGTRMITMHLSPRKNVEQILECMTLPGMEAYELTVLGDLDRPTSRYTRFLADRARSLGVARRVRSAGYIADPDRLLRTLLDHDVLLCPSRIESWSHTVVEGMALGMPVVASDIPCHREVSGGTVCLAPVASPAALADAIRQATTSGPAASARIDRARDLALSYDWAEYAEALRRAVRVAVG